MPIPTDSIKRHDSLLACSPSLSPFPPSVTDKAALRRRLEASLRDLSCRVSKFYAVRLVDDIIFLLRNELFLYALGPRIRRAYTKRTSTGVNGESKGSIEVKEETLPMTPESTPKRRRSNDFQTHKHGFTRALNASSIDITALHIRVTQHEPSSSWTAQLLYHTTPLISAHHSDANTDTTAVAHQSFVWLCEEARFMRYEFAARGGVAGVLLPSNSGCYEIGDVARKEGDPRGMEGEMKVRRRAKVGKERRLLKVRWREVGGRAEVLVECGVEVCGGS